MSVEYRCGMMVARQEAGSSIQAKSRILELAAESIYKDLEEDGYADLRHIYEHEANLMRQKLGAKYKEVPRDQLGSAESNQSELEPFDGSSLGADIVRSSSDSGSGTSQINQEDKSPDFRDLNKQAGCKSFNQPGIMSCTKASLVECIESTQDLSDNEKTSLIRLAGEQPQLWNGVSESRALKVLQSVLEEKNAAKGVRYTWQRDTTVQNCPGVKCTRERITEIIEASQDLSDDEKCDLLRIAWEGPWLYQYCTESRTLKVLQYILEKRNPSKVGSYTWQRGVEKNCPEPITIDLVEELALFIVRSVSKAINMIAASYKRLPCMQPNEEEEEKKKE